jgi:hypothetical protein
MANQPYYRIYANVSSTRQSILNRKVHPSHLDLLTYKQDPGLPKEELSRAAKGGVFFCKYLSVFIHFIDYPLVKEQRKNMGKEERTEFTILSLLP